MATERFPTSEPNYAKFLTAIFAKTNDKFTCLNGEIRSFQKGSQETPGGPMDLQAPLEDTFDPQGPSKDFQEASKGHLRTAETFWNQSSQRALKGTLRALKDSLSVLKGLKCFQDHMSFPTGAPLARAAP